MLILVGLGLVAGWVAYKGAHPEPGLLDDSPSLVSRAPVTVDRGPVPEGLSPEGWKEGPVSSFGPDNLYEKINGREGYYKSFGFQKLYYLSFQSGDRSIDVEMYDLEKGANAAGAFSGELPEGVLVKTDSGGLSAADRNALFVTRGRYYIRAIGSDEGPETKSAFSHLRAVLVRAIEGEALPWSFSFFSALGVPPAQMAYLAENAFSFGFAKDVHVGTLPDKETELFVVRVEAKDQAEALALRFTEGFLGYGRKVDESGPVVVVEDRYLKRMSLVSSEGSLVVGVRGAKDAQAGLEFLEKLKAAARGETEGY